MLADITQALDQDALSPEEASHLAGQAAFGQVGQAATKPIYSRAADTSAWANPALSQGLRAALKALVAIPTVKEIYLDDAEYLSAVLYVDACFLDGERRVKAGLTRSAQVLPLAAFASFLPKRWLAFVDNQAGEAALKKGYGKDDAVNRVRPIWHPLKAWTEPALSGLRGAPGG